MSLGQVNATIKTTKTFNYQWSLPSEVNNILLASCKS